MPAPAKPGPAFFLGLDLATDQLRASIIDETLELVGVECVDFDTDLPEYQTQGGMFTTPEDAFTTPVEMWVKALDFLLEKLNRNYDLTRIKAIGGAAQHALVWLKSISVPSLDPHLTLHAHFSSSVFALPNTPVSQDSSSHTHALALEALLGGADVMAARVGTCANASLVAAQLLRVRELWPDIWQSTGRVQFASSFLGSLIAGKWMNMCEAEACMTGMWVHAPTQNGPSSGQQMQGHWDEGVLDIVGGSREEGWRIRGWLGEVGTQGGSRKVSTISKYLVERYGFDAETIIVPFTSDHLSTYLSLCPLPSDAVMSFGPIDAMLTPAQHYLPTRLYSLFPHPAQDPGEKRRYIAMITSRNADVPRALVRDMYTKSWSAFDRLIAVVPPGGSIGLDDKLFSFWLLQGDNFPFSHVKGIYRFETGVKVNEFRDLRANPRCLLESQVLAFRVKWSRMIATGVLGPSGRGRGNVVQQQMSAPSRLQSTISSLGLAFDPYDFQTLPTRIITTGAAANFPSVANLVGDVFNAPVFIPNTQVDSAQEVPHRNAPAQGYSGRAAIGAAYIARWVWGREWGAGPGGGGNGRGLGGFEEEIRRLLGKRWVATGGVPVRTNVNGIVGPSMMAIGGGSGGNSGASTPFGSRSGLGATMFVEEEEDEVEEMEVMDAAMGLTYAEAGSYGGDVRLRMHANSTVDVGGSSGMPSMAFTKPDMNMGVPNTGMSLNGSGGAAPTTPAPLTPVVALPTGDAEAQIGLAKVAEPDIDAFMTYAAIVPEYCRLEGMLVKSLV